MLARDAAVQLGLERVLLVPVGEAPHRRLEPEPGAETRLAMVELAVRGDEALEASDIEVARAGPSYTFRTLELLHDARPGDELTFLMGADAAAAFGSWRQPDRVLELANVGVAARPGVALGDLRSGFAGLGGEFAVVAMPELGVSSTDLRERAAAGRTLRYLTPDPVAAFVAERRLYA